MPDLSMNREEITRIYNIRTLGNGHQPMLFAHGLACDQSVWHKTWPAFADKYRVILFDFIGSGDSDLSRYSSERYASLGGYAADILDICEALELTDVIFVGHSVSCISGMLASIKRPSVFSKLVMIGPSPYYINEPVYKGGFDKDTLRHMLKLMQEDYSKWANVFATMATNMEKPEFSSELEQILCKADPAITCEFAKVTFFSDNRNDLPKVEVPTFILQASQDIVAPRHIGEYMHKNIRRSELYHLQATGHCPHLTAPEETIGAIRQYLSGKL